MHIRDRIKELRRVCAADLRPNPRNWRTHPERQRDALRGILAEVGYADALLARELPDGALELIDGHLRAETTPEQEVPVLVLDVSEQEAAKLLVLLDPLAGLAEPDSDILAQLVAEVETDNEAIERLLHDLAGESELETPLDDPLDEDDHPVDDTAMPDGYQVVVECRDEDQQRDVFERLTAEGLACRLLTL